MGALGTRGANRIADMEKGAAMNPLKCLALLREPREPPRD
ncbi:hypothetical protein WQQ_04030 [Hydrocarboniphaga effusa AP103]|uniref:Uncharacterized protein n=1 Tax=Hydrocarboniphaga effusa AP103 TaxID=1172194 RepID=I8I2T7_9GAMM|nr:hypothetical protein WQQ_04030 [Hydrocarboniphaga effusa AP103]